MQNSEFRAKSQLRPLNANAVLTCQAERAGTTFEIKGAGLQTPCCQELLTGPTDRPLGEERQTPTRRTQLFGAFAFLAFATLVFA